jgi:hypothetical protein
VRFAGFVNYNIFGVLCLNTSNIFSEGVHQLMGLNLYWECNVPELLTYNNIGDDIGL